MSALAAVDDSRVDQATWDSWEAERLASAKERDRERRDRAARRRPQIIEALKDQCEALETRAFLAGELLAAALELLERQAVEIQRLRGSSARSPCWFPMRSGDRASAGGCATSPSTVQSTATLIAPLDGFPVEPVLARGHELAPVAIEVVRRCDWKRKPCGTCGLPKSNAAHRKPEKGGTCVFARKLGCANCGQAMTHRDHFGQPPSVNVFGSGNPIAFQSMKRAWSEVLTDLLNESGLPKGLAHVLVEGEVTFPQRASRNGPDQGNFRAPLEKILGDVLEEGGWLANDNWQCYEFGGLAYRYERGVSRTRLMIFPRGAGS